MSEDKDKPVITHRTKMIEFCGIQIVIYASITEVRSHSTVFSVVGFGFDEPSSKAQLKHKLHNLGNYLKNTADKF